VAPCWLRWDRLPALPVDLYRASVPVYQGASFGSKLRPQRGPDLLQSPGVRTRLAHAFQARPPPDLGVAGPGHRSLGLKGSPSVPNQLFTGVIAILFVERDRHRKTSWSSRAGKPPRSRFLGPCGLGGQGIAPTVPPSGAPCRSDDHVRSGRRQLGNQNAARRKAEWKQQHQITSTKCRTSEAATTPLLAAFNNCLRGRNESASSPSAGRRWPHAGLWKPREQVEKAACRSLPLVIAKGRQPTPPPGHVKKTVPHGHLLSNRMHGIPRWLPAIQEPFRQGDRAAAGQSERRCKLRVRAAHSQALHAQGESRQLSEESFLTNR